MINESDEWENHWLLKYKHYSKNNTKDLPWDIKKEDKNLKIILNEISLKDKKVLELGCGSGFDSKYLCELGFDVTALDISKTAINIAKENNKNNSVKFICGDYKKDIPDTKYDLIYDRGCLHCNNNDIKNTIELLFKKLNKKGKVIIISGNHNEKEKYYSRPIPLDVFNLLKNADKYFYIKLLKEINFELANGYGDSLGWIILLEKKCTI